MTRLIAIIVICAFCAAGCSAQTPQLGEDKKMMYTGKRFELDGVDRGEIIEDVNGLLYLDRGGTVSPWMDESGQAQRTCKDLPK